MALRSKRLHRRARFRSAPAAGPSIHPSAIPSLRSVCVECGRRQATQTVRIWGYAMTEWMADHGKVDWQELQVCASCAEEFKGPRHSVVEPTPAPGHAKQIAWKSNPTPSRRVGSDV